VERYEVPITGKFRFVVIGADGTNNKKHQKYKGGRGAEIHATFLLNKGEKLDIIVGENSSADFLGTGGGASFVFQVSSQKEVCRFPLIVAGGGGGAWKFNGGDASLDESGTKGNGCTKKNDFGGKDGENGNGTHPGLGWKAVSNMVESKAFGGGNNAGGGYSGGGYCFKCKKAEHTKVSGGGGGSFVSFEGEDVIKKLRDDEGHGFIKIIFVE